ncbi:MAG: porphobilinogen synthase [Tannerellaceae bacterium]|nr:porphobilinogen synthase [Tannerellaceae bacterium]
MKRFRPYRTSETVRNRYADVTLSPDEFIYPYFIIEGNNRKEEIRSMPGVYRFTIDRLLQDLVLPVKHGVNKILLFGVVDEEVKDERGTAAYSPGSLIVRTIRAVKKEFPEIVIFTDVCLCEYTSHGHCGLLQGNEVENDTTLPLLAEMARQHALAGADFVAPSSMMDGQVEAIRTVLQKEELPTRILAYSAKYASSFYGPFRDAAQSAPVFGDRKSYQMDYRTRDQGLGEIEADIEEGADWVMVKPALAYLDILQRAHTRFPEIPLVAYQVSGEYAMLKAAAQLGYLDEQNTFYESLTAIKRSGANYIITYYAKEFAAQWKENNQK